MKLLGGVIGLFAASVLAAAQPAVKETEMKVYTDPEHADADFKFQGEYASASAKLGAQVRALGHAEPQPFHQHISNWRVRWNWSLTDWFEVDFQEINHLWNPASLDEVGVVRVIVVNLVIPWACKVHRQTKRIIVILANLPKALELLYRRYSGK